MLPGELESALRSLGITECGIARTLSAARGVPSCRTRSGIS